MEENYTTYVIKTIPRDVWRDFKVRFLQDDFSTCNEVLLRLIEQYAHNEIDVTK